MAPKTSEEDEELAEEVRILKLEFDILKAHLVQRKMIGYFVIAYQFHEFSLGFSGRGRGGEGRGRGGDRGGRGGKRDFDRKSGDDKT